MVWLCHRRTISVIKSFFIRHKWIIIFTLIWTVALLQISLKNSEAVWLHREKVLKSNVTVQITEPNHPKHYDVVLSSYMRGGSTLTGLVLGHRSDSFYVYEPLWKIARWAYWRGNNTICRTDRAECQKISADKSPDAKFMSNKYKSYTGSLTEAQKILYNIYDCQFNDFEKLVFDATLTDKLGGPSWATTKSCIDRKGQHAACISQNIPQICHNATHRVTKVLRFTPDNFETLLQSREDLKIIHLFRDPRAIMNSRIETTWYPSKTLLPNAESLCKRMIVDFEEGKKLMKKYPERFRFLFYEDLNDDPLDKVKTIYKYLGMSLDEAKFSKVKNIKVFDTSENKVLTEREKNTAFWWRKKLKWDLVKEIDKLCKDVYDALGYKRFSSYDEMQDLTFKSVDIPPEYALNV